MTPDMIQKMAATPAKYAEANLLLLQQISEMLSNINANLRDIARDAQRIADSTNAT